MTWICDLGRWWSCRRFRKALEGTVSWVTTETFPIPCILSLTWPFCKFVDLWVILISLFNFFAQNIVSVMQKDSFKDFSPVIINPGYCYEKHISTQTEACWVLPLCVMAQGLNFYVKLWMEGLSFDKSEVLTKPLHVLDSEKNARWLESCTFGKSLLFWCWFWKELCMPLWRVWWSSDGQTGEGTSGGEQQFFGRPSLPTWLWFALLRK